MIYLNDGKDTIYYAGYSGEVCRVLGITRESLFTKASKGQMMSRRFILVRHLCSDLDKEEEDG